jgi:tetratricopeptide (TPR) repeat protein
MPSLPETFVSSIDGLNPSELVGARASDAVLTAYLSIAPDEWRGRYNNKDVEIIFPDPARARELFVVAAQADHDPAASVRLLEESIRLDYVGALDDQENLLARIEAYASLGRDEPHRSILLYNIGVILGRSQRWSEAAAVYHAAAHLDPLFAWHLNNLAWMAATATDTRADAGPFAVARAEMACTVSGWGCWCFLGTLAAAFARAGDFRRAIAWQRICLHLTPENKRVDEKARLREFEAGRAFTARKHEPVAGDRTTDAEVAQIDVRELLREAAVLIGGPRELLH